LCLTNNSLLIISKFNGAKSEWYGFKAGGTISPCHSEASPGGKIMCFSQEDERWYRAIK